MTKVYIIHGWGLDSNMPWIKWLEGELKKNKKIEVYALDMPNTEHPKIEEWVNYLKRSVGVINEATYFIGHSIGCQTIMRFLEKLPKNEHIKGCAFVAPWFDLVGLKDGEVEIAHPWIHNKIAPERLEQHTGNFLAIFSNNDPYVSEKEISKFKELGVKTIIKRDEGHFDNTKRIQEILEFIK
jgi:predicted alpha/beta hydrolase family esterase